MWKIKQNTLLDLLEASKNLYPREYASLLGGDVKEQLVFEYVIPPVLSGKSFAAIDLVSIPIHKSIIGSIHSHPVGRGNASRADVKLFRRYLINLIFYHPFGKTDFVAYGSNGEPMEVAIVE